MRIRRGADSPLSAVAGDRSRRCGARDRTIQSTESRISSPRSRLRTNASCKISSAIARLPTRRSTNARNSRWFATRRLTTSGGTTFSVGAVAGTMGAGLNHRTRSESPPGGCNETEGLPSFVRSAQRSAPRTGENTMEKPNQDECRCSKASCGCSGSTAERCSCGERCDCAASCKCGGGCACKAAK